MINYQTKKRLQRGVVSLFVVIFTAILIVVVTVGFTNIMIQDQQQASSADLSKSAYDSAQVGVEDAKRAIVQYQSICSSGSSVACDNAKNLIGSPTCNVAVSKLKDITITNGEVKVQTNNSNLLNQAYTCLKINLNTIDYLGNLQNNRFHLVSLNSSDAFDTVQVQWFSSNDLSANNDFNVNLQPKASLSWPLLAQNSWGTLTKPRPPIIQAQIIQFGSNGFTLNDFDDKNASAQSNTNTLFLYPSGITGLADSTVDTKSFSSDLRRVATGKPTPVTCSGKLNGGGYSCTVKLLLPAPIGGGNRTAYLYLGALYNSADYRVTLFNGANKVYFSAVQPEIDSTGRANNLFRRVKVRVDLMDINFPYPKAAISTSGGVCKDFRITDNLDGYSDGTCTPN
jgi:hypothetical protein